MALFSYPSRELSLLALFSYPSRDSLLYPCLLRHAESINHSLGSIHWDCRYQQSKKGELNQCLTLAAKSDSWDVGSLCFSQILSHSGKLTAHFTVLGAKDNGPVSGWLCLVCWPRV